MALINKDYTYNFTSFSGPNGIWHLIGSESSTSGVLGDTIDTFTDRKGNYVPMIRRKVASLADNGKIIPITTSPTVGPKPYNSKEKKKFLG